MWSLGAVSGWHRGLEAGREKGERRGYKQAQLEFHYRTGITVEQLYKAHADMAQELQIRKVKHDASP